jgi:DNA-binding PadR family transcriptional regulator
MRFHSHFHSHMHRMRRHFAHGLFGGGQHGLGRHGWRGGMRRGRLLDHGDLRFVILQLVAEKPRYGYELIKAIEEKFAGVYTPSPGVVYPTLTLLEELGNVAVAAQGAKKLYTITPEGTAFLAENQATVAAIFDRIQEASRTHGGAPAPQIVRAFENLKLALSLRLSRGPVSEEQALRLAAAIDAAAAAVERD